MSSTTKKQFFALFGRSQCIFLDDRRVSIVSVKSILFPKKTRRFCPSISSLRASMSGAQKNCDKIFPDTFFYYIFFLWAVIMSYANWDLLGSVFRLRIDDACLLYSFQIEGEKVTGSERKSRCRLSISGTTDGILAWTIFRFRFVEIFMCRFNEEKMWIFTLTLAYVSMNYQFVLLVRANMSWDFISQFYRPTEYCPCLTDAFWHQRREPWAASVKVAFFKLISEFKTFSIVNKFCIQFPVFFVEF